MGNNRNDISNQQFGRLTAKYPLLFRKRGYVLWHCVCECGNEVDVISSSLISGNTKSCGCLKYAKRGIKDLSNQRFGRLIAKYPRNIKKNGSIYWYCECDCGKSAEVLSRYLCSGSTKSCGCLKRDHVGRRIRDLTNQRFGRLTAKYSTSKRKNGSTYWYCECDCGKGIEVLSRTLCSGKTQSCGCMRLERRFSK